VRKTSWDLIIFHTIFLSSRWTREAFLRAIEKVRFFKDSPAIKVALPQDEFLNMDLVCDFINEVGINHVFTASPESEWPVIYKNVDFGKTHFHKVLTGYIDDSLISRVEQIAKKMPGQRPIDIGYRAYRAAFWLGRHGALKWKIADIFQKKATPKGLVTDISTRDEDTILGDGWYKFLLRCKYQLGVEGGASILDWDGTYRERTEKYLAQHPQATFEEVEKVCFPDADGSLKLFALSPRHLECCVTRTCQILVEGDYSGVLVPEKHYIELKRDFSNLNDVLDIVSKDELREAITTRAWQDIVASGKYTYRSFVDYVLNTSLANIPPRTQSSRSAKWRSIVYQQIAPNLDRLYTWPINIAIMLLYNQYPGKGIIIFWGRPVYRICLRLKKSLQTVIADRLRKGK
jgi:hypothetical protein